MNKIFSILISALFVFGCSEDKIEDVMSHSAEISISSETIEFETNGDVVSGENEVAITSSDNWRLTGKKTWCVPSAIEGKNGDRVSFEVEENTTSSSRSVTYMFICGDKVAKLIVTQQPKAVMDIYRKTFEVGREGEIITVRTTANFDYTYEISEADQDWILDANIVTMRTLETTCLKFNITPNANYHERSGSIRIKSKGGKEELITINQQKQVTLTTENLLYDFDPAGGSLSIDLKTNLAYRVVIPEMSQSWLKHITTPPAENPDGLITTREQFEITAASALRVGKITFESIDGSLSLTVTIKQSAENPIYITIPDDNFRKYLADNDFVVVASDGRCEITDLGLNATEFSCSNCNIQSLSGIEKFSNLTSLDCSSNYITSLDLSKNSKIISLSAYRNALETLILGDAPISYFGMAYGNLTDPSGKQSTQFTISGTGLTQVSVNGNALQMLDVSGCPNLGFLNCMTNASNLQIYKSVNQNIYTILKDYTATVITK